MDRLQVLLPVYTELLQRFTLAHDEVERELALIDATELAKTSLSDGPIIDLMLDLHQKAQACLADRWREAQVGSVLQQGREQLVQGSALPLLLALLVPHELAQRAHHEQRWRREHETLVAMFEQTDELIVVLGDSGECDDVNPAFCRATGWTRRQAVEGAADWTDIPQLRSALRLRKPQVCSDGRMLNVEWSLSHILGAKGERLSHVCVGRDVGRQQQIDDSLRENDKLRAVATLAGGVAHDFNNLLGSINGLAELCELEAPAGSRQARNLARIRQAGNKAAALVRQMLDFSRQSPPTLQRLALAAWLDHTGGLLRASLPHHQRLEIQVATDAAVLIDLVQMEQVLLNVVRNAVQAMGTREGCIRIVADLAEPSHPVPDASSGSGWTRIRISDNGEGMAPEVMDKIFEPFFTTKPVGEGTGLGLAAAHGIVSGHGGVIEVKSRVGVGTTFSIFLPLAP